MSASAEMVGVGNASASGQMFVINLAAATSPMALSNPTSPALKRFTFFVSRQREEGRERFRLHMGYFTSQEEAESLLPSVRDIYPAAWAGPAPTTGAGRRGRIAPSSVVAATPAPESAPQATGAQASAPPAKVAPPVAAAPAQAAASAHVARAAAPAAPAQPAAAKAAPAAGLEAMSNVRDVLAQLSEPAAAAAAPARPAAATAPAPKSLAATPAPAARPPAAAPTATPKAAIPAPPAAAQRPVPAAPAPVKPVAKEGELSSLAALSLLEAPVARPAVAAPAAPAVPAMPAAKAAPPAPAALPPLKNPFEGLDKEPEVRLVTPEDTQTLTDIKVDRQNNAPPCFAVQLVWSASPIDVATLPHLAIFEAYTLYNVEGNRQGRKWYGLRLGFFSDPNSATQVANYVRSDYKTVAVVPVAVKERDRAKGGIAATNPGSDQQKTSDVEFSREGMEGFELLADDRPPPPKFDIDDTVRMKGPVTAAAAAAVAPLKSPPTRVLTPNTAPKVAPKAAAAAPSAPGTAKGKPVGKRVVARRRPPPSAPPPGKTMSAGVGGPEVLESTLEILGASTLSLDDGGRETITDAAARKPAAKKSGGSFSRLLSKLGGG